jgi:hypothetical protein
MITKQVLNELLFIGRDANAVNSIKTLTVAAQCVKPALNPDFLNVSFFINSISCILMQRSYIWGDLRYSRRFGTIWIGVQAAGIGRGY